MTHNGCGLKLWKTTKKRKKYYIRKLPSCVQNGVKRYKALTKLYIPSTMCCKKKSIREKRVVDSRSNKNFWELVCLFAARSVDSIEEKVAFRFLGGGNEKTFARDPFAPIVSDEFWSNLMSFDPNLMRSFINLCHNITKASFFFQRVLLCRQPKTNLEGLWHLTSLKVAAIFLREEDLVDLLYFPNFMLHSTFIDHWGFSAQNNRKHPTGGGGEGHDPWKLPSWWYPHETYGSRSFGAVVVAIFPNPIFTMYWYTERTLAMCIGECNTG